MQTAINQGLTVSLVSHDKTRPHQLVVLTVCQQQTTATLAPEAHVLLNKAWAALSVQTHVGFVFEPPTHNQHTP